MLYRFETTATMKDYNSAKWWIDSGIVRPVEVEADDLKTAFQEWRQTVIDRDYIEISNNAIRNKSPMYKDTADGPKQTGFVITGKTEFDKGDYSGGVHNILICGLVCGGLKILTNGRWHNND